MQEKTETNVVFVMAFIIGVLVMVLILGLIKYNALNDEAMAACQGTGAAAKLDLSSFVPLCKRFR